jgi:hypothetical protein
MSEIQGSSLDQADPANEPILPPSKRAEAPVPSQIMTRRGQSVKKPLR